MKRRLYLNSWLAIFLCICFFQVAFAQEEVSYRNINVKEGLPSSEAYAILQDSKGYIWLCTDAGVCRFNGRDFTCFTTADGLRDNVVFNLFEDKKGRIWMTCYNGSVCYYENGKISSITASDSLMKILKNGVFPIFSLTLDEGDTLWLGTSYSLIKIPPEKNYKQVVIDHSFEDKSFIVIKAFKNNNVVISSYITRLDYFQKTMCKNDVCSYVIQSLGKYNFKAEAVKQQGANVTPRYRCVLMKDGTLLFSFVNNLYVYEPGKPIRQKLFENTIIFLDQEKSNDLWIGFSKGGALRYLNGNINSSPIEYFTDKSISDVLQDHEGGIWFSTLENGIYYVPMINYNIFPKNSPFSGKICGLDALGNKIFICNNKDEILMLNSNNTVDQFNKTDGTVASRPTKFYHYDDKYFLIGNYTGEIDTVRKKVDNFKDGRRDERASGIGLATLSDPGSYLFLSGNGIARLENKVIKFISNTPARSDCILTTKDQVIHLGTRNGLYKYIDEKFIPEFSTDSIFRQTITCMEEDSKGRLLLGTKQKGLIITRDGKHSVVGTAQGLPSNICTAILPDTNETIWLGSNKGISLLKINNHDSVSVITTINTSHGLPSNEITRLARRGNILYAGTKEGLCTIDISLPLFNSVPPPVIISSIVLNKDPIETSGVSEFEYNQNNFRFYIDCMSYKDMFSPSYYYRLKGYDSTLQLSSIGFIEYTNLPPGKYQLEVIGLNNNNVLSAIPAIYNFSIAKPFWLRWWFIVIEIFAGVGIISCFLMIRLNAIRKKEGEKTRIHSLIAESQMTALRSQMNPHFIFNAINSIQNYILKENTRKAYDYLVKFSKLIRMVLSNSKENMISLDQELATLVLYAELEQMRFDESFDFLVEIDQSVDSGNYLIPGMLLQPFVENAIWHGIMPLEGKIKGRISLSIQSDSKHLTITIEDNGVGRDKSKKINKSATHRSIGMQLTQNRLDILNQSQHQKNYTMEVKDMYDRNNQPAGTKIIITIPIQLQNEN